MKAKRPTKNDRPHRHPWRTFIGLTLTSFLATCTPAAQEDVPATQTSRQALESVTPRRQVTGPMANGREYHTATLLLSGKILLAGGLGSSGIVATAELFDPVTGTSHEPET